MGCGYFLYVFAEEYDEAKLLEAMVPQVSPRQMIEPLRAAAKRFTVVMLDAEMGGISVWNS